VDIYQGGCGHGEVDEEADVVEVVGVVDVVEMTGVVDVVETIGVVEVVEMTGLVVGDVVYDSDLV